MAEVDSVSIEDEILVASGRSIVAMDSSGNDVVTEYDVPDDVTAISSGTSLRYIIYYWLNSWLVDCVGLYLKMQECVGYQ